MRSVRSLLNMATTLVVAAILMLNGLVWWGFNKGRDAADREHAVTQPAVEAMLRTRANVVQIQQFLTDVSATAEEGGYDEAKENLARAHKQLDVLAGLMPEHATEAAAIKASIDEFHAVGVTMAQAYIASGREAGNALMKEPEKGFDDRSVRLSSRLAELESLVRDAADQARGQSDRVSANARDFSLAIGLAIMALIIVGGRLAVNALLKQLGGEPQAAVDIAHRVAHNELDFPITVAPGDTTSLVSTLKLMQGNLRERIEAERKVAAENLRVRIALDNVSTGVMITDPDRTIIYANKAVHHILAEAESDIRKQLPNFSAAQLVGQNIDGFHKNPAHQAGVLAGLKSTYTANLKIGVRHMRVTANPVITREGERVGFVAEWGDRTAEVNVEAAVADMVQSAARGDFDRRLSLDGKEGFVHELSSQLNQLSEVTSTGLKDVARVLRSLADGDLTRTIEADYSGLFGQLKEDTNSTVARLREVVGQIKEASDAINTASKEIAAGNQDLSSRTEEQASSLEETSSSMEEINSTVKNNADNAHTAAELAKRSNVATERGGVMVKQVVETMRGIQSSSEKIADIIRVIDSIAFQTNILALNAAVEAARAGEQGRGFAVVATEVRNLAQRSATAAKEIKTLIDESVGKINGGVRLANETGETIEEVVDAFHQLSQLVNGIAGASREQATGIEQVSSAVTQMDEVTQQNAALVEEAAAAAESLQEQANGLVRAVDMFKLTAGTSHLPGPALRDATPRQLGKVRPAAAAPVSSKPARQIPPPQLAAAEEEWEEF